MLPYTFQDAQPDQIQALRSAERREFEVLRAEMDAMLDRIADCWRPHTRDHAATIAGVTSDLARSGIAGELGTGDVPALAALRTEIGHILTGKSAVRRFR